MPQERYALTRLEIGGLDVPLASGKITRGATAMLWEVGAEAVPPESLPGLLAALGPDAKDTLLEFTDDQGAPHQARCHVLRRAEDDPGFNLHEGTLTFSFEGSLE
jgi:hypothetical protein